MSTTTPQRRRILFLDDEPAFLETVTELIGAMSGGTWDIVPVSSAREAFIALQDAPVDLAVIDVEMEVVDGIQLLGLLNRGYPSVQKVVLTGFANEQYRAACLANGAELFLEKPGSLDGWRQVFTALNELLRVQPEQGFRGVLRRVSLQDVLQMECLARSSSVMEISDAATRGEVFVERGQIIHAQTGALSGVAAFEQLLALRGGHFNLKAFVEPPLRTIAGPWEFLLMEAARKRDEAEATPESELAAAPGASGAETELLPPPPAVPVPEDVLPPAPAVEAPPESLAVSTAAGRPQITELLICSAQGEVLCEWQCRETALWVGLFEFLSQKSQRLAQGLVLGDFDRLQIGIGDSRTVLIVGTDRGVLVRTGPVAPAPAAAPSDVADDALKERIAQWLGQTPSLPGTLVRGVRFPDQTFLCDFDSRSFPADTLEQAWRCVADTFQVLTAHRRFATRLIWTYQRAVLHCARRGEGTILGVFVPRKPPEADLAGLDRLLTDFLAA